MATVVNAKTKRLTPELVLQFGLLKAKKSALKKEEDKLVPKIKELMSDSKDEPEVSLSKTEGTHGTIRTWVYAPTSSPFQIEYSEFKGMEVSYKDLAKQFYEEKHGEGTFEKYVESLPLKDCTKLDVHGNPDHKPKK